MALREICSAFSALLLAGAVGCTTPTETSTTAESVTTRGTPWLAPVHGAVASRDAAGGAPAFIWATPKHLRADLVGARATQIADWHLAQYAPAYGLTAPALANAEVALVHDTGRGGVIVSYQQRADGIEVYGERLSLIMNRNGELIALSGALHPAAVDGIAAKRGGFPLSPSAAAAAALSDVHGAAVDASSLLDLGPAAAGYRALALAPAPMLPVSGLDLARPVRVKPVLYPQGDTLTPAYFLELDVTEPGSTDAFASAYVIDARDGGVLASYPLTRSDAFEYRVWAGQEAPHIPADGPNNDATPHPTGTPDGYAPGYAAPSLISMEGFNTNPDGIADPWLPGAATESTGNNVDAYADHDQPDGFSEGDLRASLTGDHSFDRVYDVDVDPSENDEQVQAAITQIFYTTNWLHDWYYDSGFDEASGVAQADNYGRGGVDGDPLLAEAQDTNGQNTNNANMSTFGDGSPPRMQMYLWSGVRTDIGETRFEITAPESIAGVYTVASADFGPTDETSATGDLVLVDDGSAAASQGCDALVNDLAGRIAVADRGACSFVSKARNAQDAGAIALIIINNVESEPTTLPPLGGSGSDVTIPVLGLGFGDGATIKTELTGTVSGLASRAGYLEGLRHDGTIDNTIVAHEWGHYIHGRLGRCGGSQQCGAQGEGWGDFIALHMVLREGDDPHAVYPLAGYATQAMGDSYYYGIRRAPYSTDFTKNALTFRHIQDGEPLPDGHPMLSFGNNSEVHNAGEIWAAMLHEVQVALIDEAPRLSFDEAHRRMSDYIVAGLELSPPDPTYTEMRDAILAAAAANDRQDFTAMAAAFARRGAGTGAVSPPRDSRDLVGVVESYDLAGELQLVGVAAALEDGDCDGDGVLDAAESGTISVDVMNSGAANLEGTTVTLSTTTDGATFPNGASVTLDAIEPFDKGVASFDIAVDDTVEGIQVLDLTIELSDDSAIVTSVQSGLSQLINYDVAEQASATDDVEAPDSVWTLETDPAVTPEGQWQRVAVDATSHEWNGQDTGQPSDHWLLSPALEVMEGADFTVLFDHRFSFEASPGGGGPGGGGGGELVYWDGAVIEITTDDGETWTDVANYSDPGYTGEITDQSGNPLGLRLGYVGDSAGYPDMTAGRLELGDTFAGQTVKLRFRIGTDAAVGGDGWFIDNIEFQGIANTPFPVLTDSAACNVDEPMNPDAGTDEPELPDGDDGGGCGCVVGGAHPRTGGAAWLVVLLGLALVVRRIRTASRR